METGRWVGGGRRWKKRGRSWRDREDGEVEGGVLILGMGVSTSREAVGTHPPPPTILPSRSLAPISSPSFLPLAPSPLFFPARLFSSVT